MLKIYGYESPDSEDILEMSSVSICGNAQAFRLLGNFFIRCAEEMDRDMNWDHLHFLDSPEGRGIDGTDLIASKILKENL